MALGLRAVRMARRRLGLGAAAATAAASSAPAAAAGSAAAALGLLRELGRGDLEALHLGRVEVVDRRPGAVGKAGRIDDHRHAALLEVRVVGLGAVEGETERRSATAAPAGALHEDA